MYSLLLWLKPFFQYTRKWESGTLQKWGKVCNVADLPPGKICNERGKICNVANLPPWGKDCNVADLPGEGLQRCRSSGGEGLQCCRPSGGKICKGEGLQYNTGIFFQTPYDQFDVILFVYFPLRSIFFFNYLTPVCHLIFYWKKDFY